SSVARMRRARVSTMSAGAGAGGGSRPPGARAARWRAALPPSLVTAPARAAASASNRCMRACSLASVGRRAAARLPRSRRGALIVSSVGRPLTTLAGGERPAALLGDEYRRRGREPLRVFGGHGAQAEHLVAGQRGGGVGGHGQFVLDAEPQALPEAERGG